MVPRDRNSVHEQIAGGKKHISFTEYVCTFLGSISNERRGILTPKHLSVVQPEPAGKH